MSTLIGATGFHEGELAMQERAGVRADAARLAGMVAPADVSGGAARWLAERTFAALTARDLDGRLWVTPLIGPGGFLAADDDGLRIHARPAPGDALERMAPGQPVGLVAMDFATRRRLRVNGRLTTVDAGGLVVAVDQAFGNCPQYIQARVVAVGRSDDTAGAGRPAVGSTLDDAQVELVRRTDTFFLGTSHPDRGVDASHRGGAPGFVRVDAESGNEIWWPDYPGNNMFNSLGNLAVDDAAALLVLDFAAGTALQLSGVAMVDWVDPGSAGDDGGTGRRVRFTTQAVVSPAAVRLEAGPVVPSRYNPVVRADRG